MDTTDDPVIAPEWQALTATQRDILVVLAMRGRSLTTEIADALHADHTNRISRALPALQEAGLVTSVPADDRPGTGKYHDLTDVGIDVIHAAPIALEP